ncbi:phage virion morphogenesis protein [Psychrobacter sp. 1044]|uniref:phage virion morphogenesis protein n=1 Tax=Psychrobacter sp. 1044 TaxID=2772562 RepID=UPI0019183892|nr:phage virion morphogenesis protein [Psychrobacter sp. 1044]
MFDANLSGGDEIIRRLGGLYFDSEKIQKFSRLVGAEMVNQTEERFYNQHDLQRQPWLPSLRAIEQKGKTLRDTGRLMGSLTYVPLPDGVKWGTNVVYAKAMHYGLPYRNVTPRPYMGMNENDRASVLNIINRIMDVDL